MNDLGRSQLNVRVVLEMGAILGEGLHWDSARNVLWWADIVGRKLFCWRPDSESHHSWDVPERVGWVITCAGSDALLAGLQSGFAKLVPVVDEPLQPCWIARPFCNRPSIRLNDAKADASGAVWAGSLNADDEDSPDGALYRLGADGRLSVHDSGYKVANGPAIHPDGRLFLHTDSLRRCIYAFDIDTSGGRLNRKRVWKLFEEGEGYPDGMCFDTAGCVWVAQWGAGAVTRFTSEGEKLLEVRFPVSQVTNVCFGGERLERLFVTSARIGLSERQLLDQPMAGALFEVEGVNVRGFASFPYGG